MAIEEDGIFPGCYILEGHETKEVDLMTYAKWCEGNDKHVADEIVGDSRISTIFMGIDRSYGYGPPILFETMVFGGALDLEMARYYTWDEAEAGHKEMVERVKRSL